MEGAAERERRSDARDRDEARGPWRRKIERERK